MAEWKLYEYVLISKGKKGKKKAPKILDGPELTFAKSEEELKSELYYEGVNPKEVDILVRPFC